MVWFYIQLLKCLVNTLRQCIVVFVFHIDPIAILRSVPLCCRSAQ